MSLHPWVVFAAGVLTFTSPCILPLAPVYLGVLGGGTAGPVGAPPRGQVLSRTAAFALGLATVFVALGLAASTVGRLLSGARRELLWVSGMSMVILGLRSLGLVRLGFLDGERRPWLHRFHPASSLLAAFGFGGAFGLGWTPCIGPVLASVLAYTAGTGVEPARGGLLLACYAAGLVSPLLLAAAIAAPVLRVLQRVRPHLRTLERVTGSVLVVAGLLIATDHLSIIVPSTAAGVAASAPPSCDSSLESGAACEVGETPTLAGEASGPVSAAVGPAVIEVMSHHCPVCRQMEPVVAEAERGCSAHVVRAFIEEPLGQELMRTHHIRGVPTFLVLDADGAEVERLVGLQGVTAVRAALDRSSPLLCSAAGAPGLGR